MAKVELLVVPDCANARQAHDVLVQALRAVGIGTMVETVVVATDEDARSRHFIGSPSFYLDGSDLFPQPSTPALACRMYRTEDGLRGTPAPAELSRAIRSRVSDTMA